MMVSNYTKINVYKNTRQIVQIFLPTLSASIALRRIPFKVVMETATKMKKYLIVSCMKGLIAAIAALKIFSLIMDYVSQFKTHR